MSYSPPRVYQPDIWTISSHENRVGISTMTTSTAWVSGLAVYVPFYLSSLATVYEWWWLNGTLTTAHNIDFGIYRTDFTKVQSLGSTVGTTTASVIINTSTWADLTIAPGTYYMAFCNDSTRNFLGSAETTGLSQAMGIMEQTGLSSTLPSPAVPVTYTRSFIPHFGMNLRSVAM